VSGTSKWIEVRVLVKSWFFPDLLLRVRLEFVVRIGLGYGRKFSIRIMLSNNWLSGCWTILRSSWIKSPTSFKLIFVIDSSLSWTLVVVFSDSIRVDPCWSRSLSL
jgi:hypothetical protein